MSPKLTAALRDFAIAAISLLALTRVVAFGGGDPLVPQTWQEVAIPVAAAAIFAIFRMNRGGNA